LPFTMDEVRQAFERHRSGQAAQPSAPPSPSETSSAPVQRRGASKTKEAHPSLPFSMTEVRAALEQPHFSKSSAPARPSTPMAGPTVPTQPSVQRTP
jgi:hypothetical protein